MNLYDLEERTQRPNYPEEVLLKPTGLTLFLKLALLEELESVMRIGQRIYSFMSSWLGISIPIKEGALFPHKEKSLLYLHRPYEYVCAENIMKSLKMVRRYSGYGIVSLLDAE